MDWTMVANKLALPTTSPLYSTRLHQTFFVSLVFQHAVFYVLSFTVFRGAGRLMLKKRCWILTTMASLVMCISSVPYLFDFFKGQLDMHAVQPRTNTIAEPLSAFFVAYLVSDLVLGSIFYPSMINVSSGWIHHIAYTFLFSLWVHRGWSHIAALAAIFELPTLVMGIASIHPPLRSNNAFTLTFFSTRVFFHLALIFANCSKHARSAPAINHSWGPAISLVATYPMHLWWAYKCVRSIRRRVHKRKLAQIHSIPSKSKSKSTSTSTSTEGRTTTVQARISILTPQPSHTATKLVSDTVRNLWISAPSSWRHNHPRRHAVRAFLQNYEVPPFQVERDPNGKPHTRLVRNIRRRIQVARRDMVVFD